MKYLIVGVQTRDVKVYRLTVKNTIEDRILILQENKV
jgi:SNF2 family DNA or RNA helicase